MTDETPEDLPAVVPTVVDQPMDFTVIARNPQEMAAAQRSMILWAARKIQAEKELLADAQANYETARKNKWRPLAWQNRMKISAERIEFYKKVKVALEAGYYIVPPFPLDIFAVRTKRERPEQHKTGWVDPANVPKNMAEILPPGEGQYVSPDPKHGSFRKVAASAKLDPVTNEYPLTTYHTPAQFTAVDFPFKLAKPAVLDETARAMALKVFDQIGRLPGPRAVSENPFRRASPDPIICGQIIRPRGRGAVTFFIAWWLDTIEL